MPSATFVLSHPLQLTISIDPLFSITIGPVLLLAALLYDAALIALAVAVYRRFRQRRRPYSARLLVAIPGRVSANRNARAAATISLPRL